MLTCVLVWFVLLGIALLVVLVAGLYFRFRVLAAMSTLGVPLRSRRLLGFAILWLLYGLPIVVALSIGVSIAIGSESFPGFPTGVGEWLLVYPFWISVLVMLQAVPYFLLMDVASRLMRRHVRTKAITHYRAIACLGIIAGLGLYTVGRIVLERDDLAVHHHSLGTGDTAPLRIAFFADLQQDHHTDAARAREVTSRINENNPDIIVMGGDWINTGSDHIDAAALTASTLHSPLGTFSVRGDHEHFAYRDKDRSMVAVSDALSRVGVQMIHNDIRMIEHRNRRIAFLYLSYNYIHRTSRAEIDTLLKRTQDADYSILVVHQLDKKLAEQIAGKVDLALVAHTHGGQVNPLALVAHIPIARVETPYIAGRYHLGTTTIIVTTGIGFSIAPFRYASPASIEIIDLRL